MLSLKQRVDAVIRDGLAPHLKRSGYRKRGRTFRLAGDSHTRIVSISASSQVVPDQGLVGSYGVELGIFFPEVFRIGDNKEMAEPRIHECYVYSGLPVTDWGFFDDLQGNCPSVEEQTGALERAWLDRGNDWFARHSDPRNAFEWTKASENWKEALYFAIHLDERDQAAECLEQCRISWGGEWLSYLEEIAERHGVPGPGPH